MTNLTTTTDLPTLSELAHEAVKLAAMLEGIDVLYHQADGDFDHPEVKMAGNSLPPMIEAVTQKAWALQEAIEKVDSAMRKEAAQA